MSEIANPCPFCDGEAATRSTLDTPARWFGLCLSCEAMTGYSTSQEGAAIAWNRRASNDALARVRASMALLQQNAEACAANHYGGDHERLGMPGWLADTRADLERLTAITAPLTCASINGKTKAWEQANPFPEAPYGCEHWANYLLPQAVWYKAKADFIRFLATHRTALQEGEVLIRWDEPLEAVRYDGYKTPATAHATGEGQMQWVTWRDNAGYMNYLTGVGEDHPDWRIRNATTPTSETDQLGGVGV